MNIFYTVEEGGKFNRFSTPDTINQVIFDLKRRWGHVPRKYRKNSVYGRTFLGYSIPYQIVHSALFSDGRIFDSCFEGLRPHQNLKENRKMHKRLEMAMN